MRTLSYLLFTALLAGVAAAQQTEFKIGTWNLEFLGAAGNFRNNLPPRTDADYAAIGKKVHELGVCVLAVQEINDEATLQKVAAGAGPSWVAMLGTSGSWDDGKTAQHIGFVYDRAAVSLLHVEELLTLPREFEGSPIFHRVPVTACFQHKATGADFRLVTVHLKAGQKADDEKKRRGESTLLAGWLDRLLATAAEDHDVIVLGDFNSTYGTEPQHAFERSKALRYVPQPQPTPTIMHFAEPIDQVVVADACEEVRRASLAVDNDFDGMDKNAWRQTYSDHFPVTVTLRCQGDDDPGATFAHTPTPTPTPTSTPTWPPAVGSRVEAQLIGGSQVRGKLLQPLPANAQGWLVMELESDRQSWAFPLQQVSAVHPLMN